MLKAGHLSPVAVVAEVESVVRKNDHEGRIHQLEPVEFVEDFP